MSWPIRGLSLGCYSRASSARERQHGNEAGGDNRGLQISVSAKWAAALEELEETAHPAIRQVVCGGPSP